MNPQVAPTDTDVFIGRFSLEWPSVRPTQPLAETLEKVEQKIPDILHRLHDCHAPLVVCWCLKIASQIVLDPRPAAPPPSPADIRRLARLANDLAPLWPATEKKTSVALAIAEILGRAPSFLDAMEAVHHPTHSLALVDFAQTLLSV